ncbi:hypothetical protein ACFWXT_29790, partial [Bacillus cereus]|uniref:hypothetical protein n=1 Tax=Bacillus cereus TaxID=1396 RepID=UPI00366AEA36
NHEGNFSMNERIYGVPRYFRPTPFKPVLIDISPAKVLSIIAALCATFGLLVMLALQPALGFFVLVLSIAGFIGAVSELGKRRTHNRNAENWFHHEWALSMPKPSDQQMDIWMLESLRYIEEQGFDRLDLNRDQLIRSQNGSDGHQPWPLIGYPALDSGIVPARIVGGDGKVRLSHYDVTIIYLTDWKLCAYRCLLDMATGALIGGSTREFDYQNINVLDTDSDRITLPMNSLDPHRSFSAGGGHAPYIGAGDGRAIRVTRREWVRVGVVGNTISVLVSNGDEEMLSTSGYGANDMKSGAVRVVNEIRWARKNYSTRQAGGVGALEQFGDEGFSVGSG